MKNSTKWFITGGIITGVLAAGSIAHAAFHHKFNGHHGAPFSVEEAGYGHHGKKGMRLKHLDADDDNMISEAEILAAVKSRFEMFDTDGDGSIGFEEFSKRPLERFAKLDANSDLLLDRDEIRNNRKHRDKPHRYNSTTQQEQDAGSNS